VVVNLLDQKLYNPESRFPVVHAVEGGAAHGHHAAGAGAGAAVRVVGVAPGITLVSGDQSARTASRKRTANAAGPLQHAGRIAAAVLYACATARAVTGTTCWSTAASTCCRCRATSCLSPRKIMSAVRPPIPAWSTAAGCSCATTKCTSISACTTSRRRASSACCSISTCTSAGRVHAEGDELHEVVDYDFMRDTGSSAHLAGHVHLQETLCDDHRRPLLAHPTRAAARVSTEKPDVYPDCEGVGVEVFRIKEAA
jgi:dihydroneopterin aldolase